MRVHGGSRAGLALLLATGCGASDGALMATTVMPDSAYNDTPVPITISGQDFRAALAVDTSKGTAVIDHDAFHATLVGAAPDGGTAGARTRIPIDDFGWRAKGELGGTLRAGVPAGSYDVELRDSRGRVKIFPGGFRSLGVDGDAPKVTFRAPASKSVVAADTDVVLAPEADDGVGHLASFRWTARWRDMQIGGETCEVAPGASRVGCVGSRFLAPVPVDLTETITLFAEAVDSRGNLGSRTIMISVAQRPRADAISINAGPASGSTALTITGDNFVVDATDIVVDGVPIGAAVESRHVITGRTPSHDPGFVGVTVRTGSAEALPRMLFEYVGQPKIRIIEPVRGPMAGGTRVMIGGDYFRGDAGARPITQIIFGRNGDGGTPALLCPILDSENRIVGYTPPSDIAGPVTVYAEDPVAGSRAEGFTFTYDPPDGGAADAQSPGPVVCASPDGGSQ